MGPSLHKNSAFQIPYTGRMGWQVLDGSGDGGKGAESAPSHGPRLQWVVPWQSPCPEAWGALWLAPAGEEPKRVHLL